MAVDGYTVVGQAVERSTIELDPHLPAAIAGMPIPLTDVIAHLEVVGCALAGERPLRVQPPTWRPDLLIAADLVEEVVRLAGYDRLPSVLPLAPTGSGLTARQRRNRSVFRAMADAGFVEVICFPFVAPAMRELLGLSPRGVWLVNPLSEGEPELRTSLLPGLLTTAVRNVGRGLHDLLLFEAGQVFLPRPDAAPMPVPPVHSRPSAEQLVAVDAALPHQPQRLAAVLCGDAEPVGWWGPARPADWADAVEAARLAARTARVELDVRPSATAPWHPGRCAELLVGDVIVGHAGELHPRVVATLGLPSRSCAMELDLDALALPDPPSAPSISAYPPVLIDVALVVDAGVHAGDVAATLRSAAGPLLESLRLFDVYRDAERLGPGARSLAFAMRFRASDRTMTLEEATRARDRAIEAAAVRHGARLRA